jgi:phytanoyl-CoA hydroxylase
MTSTASATLLAPAPAPVATAAVGSAPGLDEATAAHFHTQGFAVLPALFSASEIAAVNDGLARIARECGADGRHPSGGIGVQFERGAGADLVDAGARELLVRKFFDMGQSDRFFWDHLRDPRIIGVLDDLVGPGARLLQCMALVKPPGIGSPKDWHQDLPYFALDPMRAIGVWIACDDTDLGNGCMQVIPRSHRAGPVAHVDGPTGWRLAPERIAQDEVLALPMAAGSALVFDAGLWHFTDANRSARRRRAVQYHYVAAGTRCTDGRELWDLDRATPPRA